ncbi:amino acid permease/ SLC12A domain-containing protein [Chytriomyces cf. hyalinus JEL632]|nr:amino acid permease/ SLC12A domain-containing protein [Chytriomyces cf. hyalinus JEL632]
MNAKKAADVVFHIQDEPKLKRKLQARHLEMIAIGGTIGTGLLKKSGGAIFTAGPLGALLCYAIIGLQVFGVATSIGEMATFLPIDGAFSALPTRFVNPSLGFASGWNYWLNWALTLPAELSAVAGLMTWWVPQSTVQGWIWSLTYLVPLAGVNMIGVDGFGEVEFVLSIIKIIAIVIFLLIGTAVWFGAGGKTGPLGFRNWSPPIQGSDPFNQFLNVAGAFTTAFFSFGGTELVGLTAGEAANVRKSVPKAINGTFYRILIFYIGSIFIVGVLLPPNSEILNPDNPAGIAQSPFVYVFSIVGIPAAADIMNGVIIVAAISAANSAIYACSRTLLRLAADGSAPSILARVNKQGVPMLALAVSLSFGLVAVVGSYAAGPTGSDKVFGWLSQLISLGIMAAWMVMSLTHLRFRYGYIAQGKKLSDLPYIAPFFPYADILSLSIGGVVTCFMLMFSFYQGNFVATEECPTYFCATWFINNSWVYCGVPLVVGLFVGHALYTGSKSGKGLLSGFTLVRYEDMDFETGRYVETEEEIAENARDAAKPKGMVNWAKRMVSKKE